LAVLISLLVWGAAAFTAWLVHSGRDAQLPAASAAARAVDAQIGLTLVLAGGGFVVLQALLGWSVWRFRSSVVLVGTVFLVLAFTGQAVWAKLHRPGGDASPIVIDVTAEQFAWNVRYAGADARFGTTSPALYHAERNPLGLSPQDVAGTDDVVVRNHVVVPVGQPVELLLGSKDVLHSFFVPALRLKQDTVPGQHIPLRFTIDAPGTWEIACAELCGLGHHRMRGVLEALPAAAFNAWLAGAASQ
jgi:cytochrome c oxidase subunit 2